MKNTNRKQTNKNQQTPEKKRKYSNTKTLFKKSTNTWNKYDKKNLRNQETNKNRKITTKSIYMTTTKNVWYMYDNKKKNTKKLK